jgi:predicted HTH domain antitoxin
MKKKLHKDLLESELESLTRIGSYDSRDEVIRDAIRNLLISRADLRLNIAIDLFRKGQVSLGQASERAGMGIVEFKDILGKKGVLREIGNLTPEVLEKQTKKLREFIKR